MSRTAKVLMSPLILRPARPEIVRETGGAYGGAIVEKPLSTVERLYNHAWLRKLVILAVLALIWEAYGRFLDNDLLFQIGRAHV